MVVTDISLVGWLVSSAESAPLHKVVGVVVAVVVITGAGFAVHRRAERLIGRARGDLGTEFVSTIVLLAVAVAFALMALDASHRAK